MVTTNRQIAHGIGWMLTGRVLDRLLSLISSVVLARLLTPQDFGVVAMATAVLAVLDLMTNFGFDVALIRHPAPQRGHFDTVWTISVLFGIAVAVALTTLAYPAAVFYDEPRVSAVMLVLAATALTNGFVNTGCVNFRRDLQFHKDFQQMLFRRLIAVPATIALVLVLRNYWALVLGSLIGALAAVAISFRMHPFRPRFSLARKGELFGFSKWLFLNSFFVFGLTHVPDLIIGKMRGPRELGLYRIASEFATMPTVELVAAVNRAAFPGYAKLAREPAGYKRTFLLLLGLIATCAAPIACGIAVTAEEFVPLLLGRQWVEAIPLFELIALAGGALAVWSNTGYIFIAVDRPHLSAVSNAGSGLTMIAAMVVLLNLNVPSAPGWAIVLTAAVNTIVSMFMLERFAHIEISGVLGAIWRPVLSAALMFWIVQSLKAQLHLVPNLHDASRLALLIAAGVAAYPLAVTLLWRISGAPAGAERLLSDVMRGYLRRLTSGS